MKFNVLYRQKNLKKNRKNKINGVIFSNDFSNHWELQEIINIHAYEILQEAMEEGLRMNG